MPIVEARAWAIAEHTTSGFLDSRPRGWTPIARLVNQLRASAGRPSGGIALALARRMATIMVSLGPTVFGALGGLRARLGRARRRSLMPRLLTKRVPRRASGVVGACAVCGIKFAASPEHRADAARVLRVHESMCPGGRRARGVVIPFLYSSQRG